MGMVSTPPRSNERPAVLRESEMRRGYLAIVKNYASSPLNGSSRKAN